MAHLGILESRLLTLDHVDTLLNLLDFFLDLGQVRSVCFLLLAEGVDLVLDCLAFLDVGL